MPTPRAHWEAKSAPLFGEFGLDYACKVFKVTPAEIEARLGRYSRGKNVGKLRGWITWQKVTAGGWVKTGSYDHDAQQGNGFVVRANLTFGHCILDPKTNTPAYGVDLTTSREPTSYFILQAMEADANRRAEWRAAQGPARSPAEPDDTPSENRLRNMENGL